MSWKRLTALTAALACLTMFFASCNNKDSPSSPTSFSGSDRELGAEPALAVPTAYGTLGWKPFGEDAIFSADDPDADADALVSAEVRRENGRSRLYVGGKEELPMGFFGVTVQGGVMEEAANNAWAQMYQSGAKIIFTDTVVTMDEDARYTRLKGELEGILETNPDAYIVIRYTPIGRLSFHGAPESDRLVYSDGTKTSSCSLASDTWIESAVDITRELVDFISQNEQFASRVIGYHPLAGTSGEWFSPDYWDGKLDVSVANLRKFRQWLEYRYEGDNAKLQTAWGDSSITFDNVTIKDKVPGLGRQNDTAFMFLTGAEQRPYLDYILYYSDMITNRIRQLARAVKLESGGRSLFFVFYGYYTELFNAVSGHFNMQALLNCEDVDCIAGPVSYNDRNEGGIGAYMSAAQSVLASGKLWFDESDYRTPVMKTDPGGFAKIQSMEGWMEVTRREMGKLMVDGAGTWWMIWFDSQDFWNEASALGRLYMKYSAIAQTPRYDVAFVIDEKGMALSGQPWQNNVTLLADTREMIYTSGYHFGYYLLDDFIEGRIDADLVVVLSCWSLTNAQTEKLAVQAQREGRTVLWMGGFGELTPAQMHTLTGMDIQPQTGNDLGLITFRPHAESGFDYSGDLETWYLEPLYKVVSEGVEKLAVFEDGTPALSLQTVGKSRQLFYADFQLFPELLNGVAKVAGIHRYAAGGDTYHGNGSLSVLHAKTAGVKTLRLPEAADVYCYFTGLWQENVTEVSLSMKEAQTEYFFIGDKAALQAAGIG